MRIKLKKVVYFALEGMVIPKEIQVSASLMKMVREVTIKYNGLIRRTNL